MLVVWQRIVAEVWPGCGHTKVISWSIKAGEGGEKPGEEPQEEPSPRKSPLSRHLREPPVIVRTDVGDREIAKCIGGVGGDGNAVRYGLLDD